MSSNIKGKLTINALVEFANSHNISLDSEIVIQHISNRDVIGKSISTITVEGDTYKNLVKFNKHLEDGDIPNVLNLPKKTDLELEQAKDVYLEVHSVDTEKGMIMLNAKNAN